jgi:hypothetical protein
MLLFFLLIAMTYPPIFRPFALCWFALSTLLGAVVSRIILALFFFVLVLPVGVTRRLFGKDAMRLNCWKKGAESVFRVRNHKFVAKDLEPPY